MRRLGKFSALLPLLALPLAVASIDGRARTRVDSAAGATEPKTVWDSVYSMAQAGRGETAYAKTCARCHGASLGGGDEAPALSGGGFLGNWNGLPLNDLHERIRTTMPSDTVGIYSPQLVTDVIAFLLKANGMPAGAADLATDKDSLKAIMIRASRP